jgi:hypothetical protein
VAQEWIREHRQRWLSDKRTDLVSRIDYRADATVSGEGWWWREVPGRYAYRWTGPGRSASLELPSLSPGRYEISLEAMGTAHWATWDSLQLAVNGHVVSAVRERFGPFKSAGVMLRLHAEIGPEVVASQRATTSLVLGIPSPGPVPGQPLVLESHGTVKRDERLVGVAVHRIRITPATCSLDAVPLSVLARSK